MKDKISYLTWILLISFKTIRSIIFVEEDEDAEEEWPPFRKVGHFDPFSDDPRLAVKKVSFCAKSGRLIIGGTAGQVVVLDLMDSDAEMTIHPVKTDLVIALLSFVIINIAYLNLLGRKQFGQNWMVLVVQFKAELVELLPETAYLDNRV